MGQAKFLYGIFFAFGGLGAICGSRFTDCYAMKIGSLNLLFGSLPLLCLLAFSFYFLLKLSEVQNKPSEKPEITSFAKGVKAIRNSKYLLFILSIVVLMQVVTTLVYHQFNISLESAIAHPDLRTEYYGRTFGYANLASLGLQIFGVFLLVHFLGLRRSHIAVPVFLLINAAGSLFFPSFAMVTAAFVTIKSFDFSLFAVLKEMLYIPLKQEEKFQAKAIIDIFAYRSSKAVASCLILVLQVIGFVEMSRTLSWAIFLLLSGWVFLVYRMFQLKAPETTELEVPVEE
jgi:AAA family ATP:ADP antiporter